MTLLLVLAPSECLEEVQRMIESHEVHAFTEIPDVPGAGRSGRKMGTRAFPGTSSLLLTILESADADRLVASLRNRCGEGGDTPIRIFAIPATSLV